MKIFNLLSKIKVVSQALTLAMATPACIPAFEQAHEVVGGSQPPQQDFSVNFSNLENSATPLDSEKNSLADLSATQGSNQETQPPPASVDDQARLAEPAPASSVLDATEAQANFEAFKEHFGNFLAGHPEGVFIVTSPTCKIYLGPNKQQDVVGYLEKGAYIHALSITAGWVKIGRAQYVELSEVRSAGLRTRGTEAYRDVCRMEAREQLQQCW